MRITVMGKASVPGRVKTRLEPRIGPDRCAALNSAMMHDTLTRLRRLHERAEIIVALSGEILPGDVPDGIRVVEQQGSDLGARMLREIARGLVEGHESVILIGTDHPTLPLAFVDEAITSLQDRRAIVLGPSDDGGYYLIGMSRLLPELFRNMTWSMPSVFEETVARATGLDADVTILPSWYDVDTGTDLDRLIEDLQEFGDEWPRLGALLI